MEKAPLETVPFRGNHSVRTDVSILPENSINIPTEICRRPDLGATEKLVYGLLVVKPAATCRECAAALGLPTIDLMRSLVALRTAGLKVPNA